MSARVFSRCAAVLAAAVGVLLTGPEAVAAPTPAPSAVVVMYHRFGEDRYPSTNIRLDQFEAHIAEMTNGKYNVRPVPEIVAALQAGRPLPPFTIGLSIDDAFLSVYREAWPRLRAAGLPFTLFVATDPVDRGIAGYMSWDQIRELATAGVTIGNHTVTHAHMPMLSADRTRKELAGSNARFVAELGKAPALIAYPYGEYSLAIRPIVQAAGFTAGFGQHSGVMHAGSDFFYLPRFALNEHYGDLARFRLVAQAMPLPVRDITPADPFLTNGPNPPMFGFTVDPALKAHLSQLACYVRGQDRPRIERLGDTRIEVRMNDALPPGRGRINCTLPGGDKRWRWFGRQFLVSQP